MGLFFKKMLSRAQDWHAAISETSGGSFAVRQLYTDQDEVLFEAARPVILNGIDDIVTRPDLADARYSSKRRPEQRQTFVPVPACPARRWMPSLMAYARCRRFTRAAAAEGGLFRRN